MDESDEGLIRFLMRDRHGTPFEHGYFRFTSGPIFVAREQSPPSGRASFNEFGPGATRSCDADFYVPDDDVRTQVGKPGAYSFEPVDPAFASTPASELRGGVRARRTRPTSAWSSRASPASSRAPCCRSAPTRSTTGACNPRSLMNFFSLRNSEFAQLEIREYAEAVESFLERAMPVTHAAFVANGRTAP